MQFCPHCSCALAERLIAGTARLACPACPFVHGDHPIPVVAGLVQWQGQWVLAKNATEPAGQHAFITGFLERGETPEAAIAREVHATLALTATEIRYLGYYPFFQHNQLILGFWIFAEGDIETNADLCVVPQSEIDTFDFGDVTLAPLMLADWLKIAPPPPPQPWYLYILECTDNSLYTGIAVDVLARYRAHVRGKGARYTKSHPPRALLAAIAHPDRRSAAQAEYALKQRPALEKRRYAEAIGLPEALASQLNGTQPDTASHTPSP